MKHILPVIIACTLFPLSVMSQEEYCDPLTHVDDTLDVEYTKEMLQGKLWILQIEDWMYTKNELIYYFETDSVIVTGIMEDGKKLVSPCVYYLNNSYLHEYDDENTGSNESGKYLQVKFLDTQGDGTGKTDNESYWIRKLTSDTLEIVPWGQGGIMRFHAKPS